MTDADVPGAVRAWRDSDIDLRDRFSLPPTAWGDDDMTRTERRTAHFRESDPDGSWVATTGGEVVGLAEAQRREGLWVLSHLFVAPEAQNRGAGRALIERTLAYGAPTDPGIIVSSRDPRAMRRYALAGFDLHPSVVGWGPVRRSGLGTTPAVRDGTATDLDLAAAIDRRIRGAARTTELELCLSEGDRLIVVDDRGYAILRGPRVAGLAALDEDAATQLLTAGLAQSQDGDIAETARITARQQWAVRVALAAGLELHAHGAVMLRGDVGPLWPYLPDGALG